jgi:hypothetical protein
MGARLAWNILLTASGVVITSSADATGFPASNLSNPARWKPWRSSTTTGDQWVKFDLGANKSLQVFAAINATIHAGGTLRVQANATDAWGSPTIDDVLIVPATDFTRVWVDWRVFASSLRWVRFYFTNTGAVSSYVELGAAFTGLYLEPTRSISPELTIRRVDPSEQRVAIGGQRSAVLRAKYHEVSATFVLQTATARNDLRALYETVGATTPVLLAVDPLNPSLIFYGTLASALTAQNRGPDLWDVPVEFVEDVA